MFNHQKLENEKESVPVIIRHIHLSFHIVPVNSLFTSLIL